MRARRAGTAPKGQFVAAGARRGWQQSYRCLPRAQPGSAPRRRTRPDPSVHDRKAVVVLKQPPDPTPPLREALRELRPFLVIWAGQLVSALGSGLTAFA